MLDQKNKVSNAINKLGDSEELQEALTLINMEIIKSERELQETYSIIEKNSKESYLDKGFVEARIQTPVSGLKVGYKVYVNAEEYTSLGDNDLLNIIDPKDDKEKIVKKVNLKVEI